MENWQEDAIVDIPEKRIRYFGGPGKMLLPCPATVAAVISKVPENKLITSELIRKTLSEQFDVEGVCPITTQKALQAIAKDESKAVAYWRVIRSNGQVNKMFPGGAEEQADRLREAGFSIDFSGEVPKVKQFKDNLVRFG